VNVSSEPTNVITFQTFWPWLKRHFNCILRAGGPDYTLFDMPDIHWHLEEDLQDGLGVVQLFRNKAICGEMLFRTDEIAYVQVGAGENEQTLFELVAETPEGHMPLAHFLLAHPMDDDEQPEKAHWTH